MERDAAEVQRLPGPWPDAERGLQRVFSLPEETLAERRERGEARSGRQLADLALYYELPLAPGAEAGDVTALLDALNALPSVEIAYARPPAEPASLPLSKPAAAVSLPEDPTPSFQDLQGYLNAAPQGVDAFYAWTQPGGRGQGIKVVDITPQLGAPLHSGDPYGFAIAGRCGVPATARAVALNITAVSATANGHLALWPRHLTKPQTSSVNFSAGQTRAGNGILLLSPDGEIAVQSFLTDGGAVHLLLDVAGYFE